MRFPWRRSYVVLREADPSGPDRPRLFTQRHRDLLATFPKVADEPWSQSALRACLDRLRTSTITEASEVAVEDAWLDGPTSFCVVYRVPQFAGLVAVRREAADARQAIEGDEWDHTMMTSMHDMGDQAVVDGQLPDPVGFGWNVADFDIGEPHDPVAGSEVDDAGVYWHGTLIEGRPPRR